MIVARPQGRNAVVKLFVFIPFLALLAAVPLVWGWGLSWIDVGDMLGCGWCRARPGWWT
jgi:stearoyl-CoA desaturase (delta-9 desaturase)